IPSAFARLAGGSAALGLGAAALVALVALAAVVWMYRRNGVPFLYRTDGARPDAQPARALAGVGWAALMTAVPAFSPQTNTRHLSLLLFVLTAAVLLLAFPRRGVARWPLCLGTVVLVLGLVLPPGSQDFGERLGALFTSSVESWRAVGGPSWCALAM